MSTTKYMNVLKFLQKSLWFLLLTAGIFLTMTAAWSMRFEYLKMIGNFLIVHNEPHRVDCIVVLAGAYGERMEKAAKLFHEGYSEKMIVTGAEIYEGVNESRILKDHAVKLGIPEMSIITDPAGWDTYTSAYNVLKIMCEKGFRSAMIVSSPHHMRRVKISFERKKNDLCSKMGWGSDDVLLYYIPSSRSIFHKENWWNYAKDIKIVFYEYTKLIFYYLRL